jgi:hypothetical protein
MVEQIPDPHGAVAEQYFEPRSAPASFPGLRIEAWFELLHRFDRPGPPWRRSYECGIQAASDARQRYTVRFYIIAILYVIFDVEWV